MTGRAGKFTANQTPLCQMYIDGAWSLQTQFILQVRFKSDSPKKKLDGYSKV
jgi:hypothetical protein